MKWLELHIDTNHNGLDTVVAMLSALDIDGVVIDDETDFQEFLENNHQYWDYVDEDLEKSMQGKSRITFYLLDSETGYSQLAQVRIALQKLKEERDDCGTLLLTMEALQSGRISWEDAVTASAFAAGKELLGHTPPWGILTGIRPAKVAGQLLRGGRGILKTKRIMRDEYFLNPQKAALAVWTTTNPDIASRC